MVTRDLLILGVFSAAAVAVVITVSSGTATSGGCPRRWRKARQAGVSLSWAKARSASWTRRCGRARVPWRCAAVGARQSSAHR
jgi:hypothetical protein